ncbi:glycoside hydrolase family 15 protein [Paenibacillus sp. YYML68]|uniref:glycoside hydrolase family 15 protein n=1 Tax=Paenibacillus sp. YYML68 TaxID=2909250 RepID=UPI002492F7C7|nr:glycoside hydrolase family 15 protein [Paenibacillus sp. YYML68]
MARDLPVGNGNVLVNFDTHYNMRDIYFPYVGQENQAIDHLSHFGVWTAEDFMWIDHPELKKKAGYLNDSMITNVTAVHERLGLKLLLRDGVDHQKDVFVRKVVVTNDWDRERTVKLYFHLDLHLYGNGVGDTVYYDPDLRSLVFYKGHRYMSLSCRTAEGSGSEPSSFAIGQKGIHRLEGTWRDAEDGQLGCNPIAQGSVDGTIELELTVPAGGSKEAWFWISFGRSYAEVKKLEAEVRSLTPHRLLQRTYNYWLEWLASDRHDLSLLTADMASFYKRSLLIIRTNMDNRGAIVAANDSDILKFARDTYSYMWPRDGALITHALDRSGYHALTRRFFNFCKNGLAEEGYLLHKYNPDGSAGSSWHPYIDEQGGKRLPIQEDETALVLYALWHHHKLGGTLSEAGDDYKSFVIPAADFLAAYMDASGLVLPSYDLWEERYGVHLYTAAAVYGGLQAAAMFAEQFRDKLRAIRYRDEADKLKLAVERSMVTEDGRFVRSLYWNADRQTYEPDMTLDASMYGVFDFGLFPVDDARVVATMKAIRDQLWVKTDVGGIARYTNDYYHQVTRDVENVPGNPWFICTLWYAEYVIAAAKDESGLKEAEELLRWTMGHALPSGVLAEQLHPFTGAPLSVSPLTWSHASFVKVVQEYVSKLKWFRQHRRSREDVSDARLLASSATGGAAE